MAAKRSPRRSGPRSARKRPSTGVVAIRNVTGHLPGTERPLIQRKLRAAWANPDAEAAQRELEALARALDKKRPGAASLREGLADALTVNRLGVTGSLLKTVESTNPVESMIEIVRHHARRVKRWQHGEMAPRWTAAGMLTAEAQFRRVKGFRQLPQLLVALEEATADQPGTEGLDHRVAG
ncbi:MAG: transposase [Egibacteraceae bacterium]